MDYQTTIADYPSRSRVTEHGSVAWREAGSGPALVLLHGISSGSASWLHQLQDLRDSYRVIAWDAPGYADSTALTEETPLAADYATVLGQLVDALGLKRFTLVGHSLGALMAAAYAAAQPQRIARLLLMSPARGYAEAPREEREQRYSRRMDMLDRLGPEGLANERAAALLSADASASKVEWIGWNMRRLHPAGYRQAARMLAHDDIGRYAAHYSAPVAVLSGAQDQITPVARCRVVASQFPAGTYHSLPGAGHALYLEDPEQTNAFLRDAAAP